MSKLAVPRGLLQAPADRPAGRRGPRGPVAAAAALGALLPLAFSGPADETSWGQPAMIAAGATLIGGAVLLWTARRGVAVAAAFALVVLGAVGGFAAISSELRTESRRLRAEDRVGGAVMDDPAVRGPRFTKAQVEAVPVGLTRRQLRRRLGAPASYGIQRITDGPDLRCWAYWSRRPHTFHAFCFEHGRYAELMKW